VKLQPTIIADSDIVHIGEINIKNWEFFSPWSCNANVFTTVDCSHCKEKTKENSHRITFVRTIIPWWIYELKLVVPREFGHHTLVHLVNSPWKNLSLFHLKQIIDSSPKKHFGTIMIKGKYNKEKTKTYISEMYKTWSICQNGYKHHHIIICHNTFISLLLLFFSLF